MRRVADASGFAAGFGVVCGGMVSVGIEAIGILSRWLEWGLVEE
jgi:hypothetical protein